MDVEQIAFAQTGYFSRLICDYLAEDPRLREFYGRFPNRSEFGAQVDAKAARFSDAHREILYQALKRQYEGTPVGKAVGTNLAMLKEPNSFTVVTGHQLNIFTGPLYFVYKIVTAIRLARILKTEYPKYNFIPVYWMATEDHDFEEIRYFNLNGKKLQWNPKEDAVTGGAVGRMATDGLDEVYEALVRETGHSDLATSLQRLFKKAYLEHGSLADATRYLVNELFGQYGLVIVDGDDRSLKQRLVPLIKDDVFEHTQYGEVTGTIERLRKASDLYRIQVNPREVNYFYLGENSRQRIVRTPAGYAVQGTNIQWDREGLGQEIENHPERFSPNVIARPLYQELVLPNLCYIGGGGEIAYWLELRSAFRAAGLPFPILMLRNSALIVSGKQQRKLQRMDIPVSDLFMGHQGLIDSTVRKNSVFPIDFSAQKQGLETQFKALYELAQQTDASFLGAVKAQEIKQKKGLDNLEKRLLKAQKRKLGEVVSRVTEIQDELFPNGSLQERIANFSEPYLAYGPDFIPALLEALDPFSGAFTIITDPSHAG